MPGGGRIPVFSWRIKSTIFSAFNFRKCISFRSVINCSRKSSIGISFSINLLTILSEFSSLSAAAACNKAKAVSGVLSPFFSSKKSWTKSMHENLNYLRANTKHNSLSAANFSWTDAHNVFPCSDNSLIRPLRSIISGSLLTLLSAIVRFSSIIFSFSSSRLFSWNEKTMMTDDVISDYVESLLYGTYHFSYTFLEFFVIVQQFLDFICG